MMKKKLRIRKTERITFRATKKLCKTISRLAKQTGRRSQGELIHDILEEKLIDE